MAYFCRKIGTKTNCTYASVGLENYPSPAVSWYVTI